MGKRGPKRDTSRDERMVCLYREGFTLQEVGDEFGVTRERVRQILSRNGVTSDEGGRSKKAADREEQEEREKEQKCLDKWGVSRREYRRLRAMDSNWWRTPLGQFVRQRQTAKTRGIEWNITFPEWWGVWKESGVYGERGVDGDGYVMARYGDEGAYEVGNVRIIRSSDNIREYHFVSKHMRLTNAESSTLRLQASAK